jgi:hypothetical protein
MKNYDKEHSIEAFFYGSLGNLSHLLDGILYFRDQKSYILFFPIGNPKFKIQMVLFGINKLHLYMRVIAVSSGSKFVDQYRTCKV